MKIFNLSFCLLACCTWMIMSCSQGSESTSSDAKGENYGKEGVTESGIAYTILRATEKSRPDSGEVVSLNYRGTLPDSTEFDNSYDRGKPFSFALGQGRVIKGWDEIVGMMRFGEKWRVVIPPNMGYGERASGPIPANSTLIFEMELLAGPEPFDIAGKKEEEDDNGIKYVIVEEGSGEPPTKYDLIKVHYSGYFQDGKKFDSSLDRGEPIEFNLGMGRVIRGWDIMLAQMKPGEKRHVVIPPDMAYGEDGKPPRIAPNTTLVFDMELISFTTPNKPEAFDISSVKEKTTEAGMKYYTISSEGAALETGQIVTFDATFYRADGNIEMSTILQSRPMEGYPVGSGNPLFDPIMSQLTSKGKARFYVTDAMTPPQAPSGMYVDIEVLSVGAPQMQQAPPAGQ